LGKVKTRVPNSINSFGKVSITAAVAGFVVAALFSITFLQSTINRNHQERLADAMTAELVHQVNAAEANILDQIRKLATSSRLINAIDGSDAEILKVETELADLLSMAARIRIIKRGAAQTDASYPPFNFIAVDIVRSLEEGQAPHPEAISSGPQMTGERWVLFASEINSEDGRQLATLVVYVQADHLTRTLSKDRSGQVKIVQTIGQKPMVIATTGNGNGQDSSSIPLNNPNWHLEYSGDNLADSNQPGSLSLLLGPSIIMLLIVIAGIFVNSSRTSRLMQRDLDSLGRQISKVADSGFDENITFNLEGFSDQNSRLKNLQVKNVESTARSAEGMDQAPEDLSDRQSNEAGDPESDNHHETAAKPPCLPLQGQRVPEQIFRAYDIRGVVGTTLSEDIARKIGRAIGSEAAARGQQAILVGFDGREYSPALAEALIEGLTASGRDVINIGLVPSPVLYYGTRTMDTRSGVMVTGSHNGPDYNGFKIVLDGKTIVGDEIRSLYERICADDLTTGKGDIDAADLKNDYLDAIVDDVFVAQPLKIVVDCSNGAASVIAPQVLDALGCEVVPLYTEIDGTFPNHLPDPTRPENLVDLIQMVRSEEADLGIGLDGDGDRLVAITPEGNIVWPDRLLMLFAQDIVSRNPGADVVYDIKCSRHLNNAVSGVGGRPVICRSGHSFVKQKMHETGALLGGELSGHICIAERWFGFDDGIYAAARLLEIVGSEDKNLTALLERFPASEVTPEIYIAVEDDQKFDLLKQFTEAADFQDATLTSIDGLRVDFADGWGLIRASNTQPALNLRFEADNEASLEDIKMAFRELLKEVREDLDFT